MRRYLDPFITLISNLYKDSMDDLDELAAMLGDGIEELLRCIELPCVHNDKVHC